MELVCLKQTSRQIFNDLEEKSLKMSHQSIDLHDEDVHLKIDERDNIYYEEQQKMLIHQPLPVLPTYSLTNVYLWYESVVFTLFVATYLYRFFYFEWSYKSKVNDVKEVLRQKHSGRRLNLYAKWLLEDSAPMGTLIVDFIVMFCYMMGRICTRYVMTSDWN